MALHSMAPVCSAEKLENAEKDDDEAFLLPPSAPHPDAQCYGDPALGFTHLINFLKIPNELLFV